MEAGRAVNPGDETRTTWFVRIYPRLVLVLLAFQYAFVNLVFTTYTQNIVILKDIAAPLFSLLILGTWVCGDLYANGRWTLPRHGIVTPMAVALIGWGALVFLSPTAPSAVELWGRTAGYFVQTWAILRFARTRSAVMGLLVVVIAVNALMVGYGLMQLADCDLLVRWEIIPDWGSRVYVSTHGSPNFLAGVLVCTLPLLIGLWFITRDPVAAWLLPVLVGANVYAIIETTNRAAYLGLIVTLLVVLVSCLAWSLRPVPWRRRAAGVLALILLAVAAEAVLEVRMGQSARERRSPILASQASWFDYEANYANWVRLVFFRMGLDGALESPVLGRGLASFNFRMPESRPSDYHRTGVSHNTDHAHNEHIEWLHDGGIFGLVLFWWILAAYAVAGRRGLRSVRGGVGYPFAAFALLGPVNQWIQATFDVETRWSGNNVTLWFVVGLALAAARAFADRAPDASGAGVGLPVARAFFPGRALGAAVVSLALVVAYAVFAGRAWMADHHLRNNMAFTDGGVGSIQSAIREAEAAARLNPHLPSNYYKLAYSYLVADRPLDAIEAYRNLQAFAPNYAQIHINLAYVNDVLGRKAASAWERDRAAAIEHNVRNHRDAARYWLKMGYPTRADAHLRHALTVFQDRNDAGYWFWHEWDDVHADLARVALQVGDTNAAFLNLERAFFYNPDAPAAAVLALNLMDSCGWRPDVVDRVVRWSPGSAAAALVDLRRVLERREDERALALMERMAATLVLPAQTVSEEAEHLGNHLLAAAQVLYERGYEHPRCMVVAGWIYACQGRYEDAEALLAQSFQATRDMRTAERLGKVRARREIAG